MKRRTAITGQAKLRACVGLGLAGTAVSIGVQDAQAAFPGDNGRIAFAVNKWRPPDPCRPDPHDGRNG